MKLRSRSRTGFTLVEAVVSTAITAVAGSALLLGLSSSLATTNDVMDLAIAQGIADQLADEIAGSRFAGAGEGAHQAVLGPSSAEAAGADRSRFDDVDDYNGYSTKPPGDPWGVMLGLDDGAGGQRHPNFQIAPEFLSRWRVTASVYYLDPNNLEQRLAAGQTSDYRGAEVMVYLDDPQAGLKQLAAVRRVFAYVPSP